MKKNVSSEIISGEFVNMTKQVNESFPSIFTKDDVTRLLIELEQRIISHETEETEESVVKTSSNFDVKELVQRIKDSVRESIEDYDFDDSVSLELTYSNQIEISVEYKELIRNCKDEIDSVVENYFEEIEEEVED